MPLRIEIGPRDVAKGSVVLARRDVRGRAGKSFVSQKGIGQHVTTVLDEIQQALLERAISFRDANTHDPTDYEHFREIVADGFARTRWCGSANCEASIKEETKATNRCILLDPPEDGSVCIYCGQPAKECVYFARAY